jgi:hypothetical protein
MIVALGSLLAAWASTLVVFAASGSGERSARPAAATGPGLASPTPVARTSRGPGSAVKEPQVTCPAGEVAYEGFSHGDAPGDGPVMLGHLSPWLAVRQFLGGNPSPMQLERRRWSVAYEEGPTRIYGFQRVGGRTRTFQLLVWVYRDALTDTWGLGGRHRVCGRDRS